MKISRRNAIKQFGLLTGSFLLPGFGKQAGIETTDGRINHSVCRWPYSDISLEQFCQSVKEIGFTAIDLVGPEDWPTLKKYDLYCAMANGAELGLTKGFNNSTYHDRLVESYEKVIPQVAEAGFDKLICFSGNREGMDDETGLKNSVTGLKRLLPLAEEHGVTLCMELLNSKVDHPDHMCDHTGWGVALCDRLGSDHFRLLYDIYHMQIMEGDVIRTIRNNSEYFAHYHTGGVPGRHEIDDSQELNYPAIMRAIADTGFEGYVAQEFIPSDEDKLKSLEEGYRICNV